MKINVLVAAFKFSGCNLSLSIITVNHHGCPSRGASSKSTSTVHHYYYTKQRSKKKQLKKVLKKIKGNAEKIGIDSEGKVRLVDILRQLTGSKM